MLRCVAASNRARAIAAEARTVGRLFLCAVIVAACHHEQPPPPVVVSSSTGTPVGYLIDSARTLHLRDSQLAQLRAIDAELANRLKAIDAQLARAKPRSSGDAPVAPVAAGPRRGMAGATRGRRRTRGSAAPPAGASAEQLTDLRIAIAHDAVVLALAVLDAQQRVVASEVLESHDVDVDVDHPTSDDGDRTDSDQ